MEFYGFIEKCSNGYKSFNSQRDGILRKVYRHDFRQDMFQFPTGWNSTYFRLTAKRQQAKVSIPNGMEFYANKTIKSFKFAFVSIPNGMEFYMYDAYCKDDDICFNSQRDGILLKSLLYNASGELFQFPTGWNSTVILRRYHS